MSSYDLFARLYDLEHRDFQDDVELYCNFAERCDGRVLELGCGTGRVTLALAKAGFDVMGVDDSAPMLALARTHAADAGLSERVRLEQIDVRALEFDGQFALAIFPLNGFLHLTTVSDQLSALHNIYRALLSGGLLILDLPNPHAVFTPSADGQLVFRRRLRLAEGHSLFSFASTQTDLGSQIQSLTLIYDEVGGDGVVCRTTIETELRFVYRYEMVGLLRHVGFQVDAVYGSYDLDPYEGDSHIMLFVAHK